MSAAPTKPRIRILPAEIVRRIAAGEVIERPVGAVRELVENALDAAARSILVELVAGGCDSIAVLDDGYGMSAEDAQMAIQRHATSKFSTAAALGQGETLGFRGEALAAIAAVSSMTLSTCKGDGNGVRLAIDNGHLQSQERIAFPRGTRVHITKLFAEIPARLKFLRSSNAEYQQVHTALNALALANPQVHFQLRHNGRQILDWPAVETLGERIFQALGRETHAQLLPVSGADGELRFEGFVSHPIHSRASQRWQFLTVNSRPVRHPLVRHGVQHAYRNLLTVGRHAAFVLQLRVPPQLLDVNVHPAKTEVRLYDAQRIHALLANTIRETLKRMERAEVFGRAKQGSITAPPPLREGHTELPSTWLPKNAPAAMFSLPEMLAPFSEQAASTQAQTTTTGEGLRTLSQLPTQQADLAPASVPGWPAALADSWHDAAVGQVIPHAPIVPEQPSSTQAPLFSAARKHGLHTLCQFQNTYIVAQRGRNLLLIDQHAAHERVLFEQYRTQHLSGTIRTELLLLPLTLELSPQNALVLEQYLPQWAQMGFVLEPFGRGSFLLRETPALLQGRDWRTLFLDLLDDLALFGRSGRMEETIDRILASASCHAAIRAGQTLARAEMEQLLEQLDTLDVHLHCPHGRPVWVELSLQELERRFRRT